MLFKVYVDGVYTSFVEGDSREEVEDELREDYGIVGDDSIIVEAFGEDER